jgi:hypothetical protein
VRAAVVVHIVLSCQLACGYGLFWLSADLPARHLERDGELPPFAPGTSPAWYHVPRWLVVVIAVALGAAALGLMTLRATFGGRWAAARTGRAWAVLAPAVSANLGLIVWFWR